MILLLALACSEFTVTPTPAPPVAEPPGSDPDEWGEPPDWTSCTQQYDGRYYNLPGSHPDLFTDPDSGGDSGADTGLATVDPSTVDWWAADYAAFDRLDATLDRGGDWWPVDQGFEGDPGGWSARWLAWLRITEGGDNQVVLGASSDAWVMVDGEVVASVQGNRRFDPEAVTVALESGQRRLEVRMAHRGGESGLAFRAVGDDLAVCVGE